MSQKRYAFLIGANGPENPRLSSLNYAERDVERLATALKVSPCAFTKAEWTIAANREATLTELKAVIDQCEPSDLLLVHFSGHGLYDEQLYLICNGTDITNLEASAIGVDTVKRYLRKCKARYKLLILDCCYAGGAFSGAFRGEQDIEGMLSKELKGSASVILSACSRLERARELASLDGGAGFLSWVLLVSCTTRLSEVSPDHRSLCLMDIWRWMPAALAEVNNSLGGAEQLPPPVLISQIEAGSDGELWLTETRRDVTGRIDQERPVYKREHFLSALLADHSSFMNNRLNSFVGRERELSEIRQQITEKQQTGGYVTITGPAGQGKSSMIAKLVDIYQQECGSEKIAFHFIPFNPGPDHQVGLLRDLMARLILKYNLSDLYVASDSRSALRDYFPKVLKELAVQGGQEVIFIDGLDQLEAEQSGERDLSFLPNNPPVGVAFVLGTRPNDTLRPLELLKPHVEYQLPDLSREDFERVLHHRKVQLGRGIVERFYAAMQGNALYLDLLAKELAEQGATAPEVLNKQIADNPEHLFSLTMTRLKRQPAEWREVIKPILGVLLVAQQPLGVRHIRQILGVDDDRLREGIERLGGLIVRDWQQCYSLFHLKLYEYLRQDEQRLDKEYIFASDEEEGWHNRLAEWCEQGNLAIIWQNARHDATEQQRREYARQHYVTHLYQAHEWVRLFEVLDSVPYGKAKIGDDPSTHSYAQDLDLGRQAASWEGWTLEEGLAFLPRLWRYTLLRCSLTSRADQYPLAAFQLLVLLKCEKEALGLAELLTDPAKKVQALLGIAKQLREQSDQEKEWLALFLRAGEIARTIEDSDARVEALVKLVTSLVQTQQWEQAQAVIGTVEASFWRTSPLAKLALATSLAQAQQWEQAQTVIDTIEDNDRRAEALAKLATSLTQARQWEQAQAPWAQAQAIIDTIEARDERARALAELAISLAQGQQWKQAQAVVDAIEASFWRARALVKLATSLAQERQWERAQAVIDKIENSYDRTRALAKLATSLAQERQWEQAQTVIGGIEASDDRAEALAKLATSLAQKQQWEQAQALWNQVQAVIDKIENSYDRARTLAKLATSLAQAQQWNQTRAVIDTIEGGFWQTMTLAKLATSLAQGQQWEQAQVVWNQAQAVIDKIGNSYDRARALEELATSLAQERQWKQAQALWKQAQAVIDEIENSYEQAEALTKLATSLVQARQWSQAQAVIGTTEASDARTRVLAELAMSLAQAQQWEQAQVAWKQAQAVIDTIEASDERAQALTRLAMSLAQAKQWSQAQAVIDKIEASDERAQALARLAMSLAQIQQWEQAQAVIDKIEARDEQAQALARLAGEMASAGEEDALVHVIHSSWQIANKREEALELFPTITCLILYHPELGFALYEAFTWIDSFFLEK